LNARRKCATEPQSDKCRPIRLLILLPTSDLPSLIINPDCDRRSAGRSDPITGSGEIVKTAVSVPSCAVSLIGVNVRSHTRPRRDRHRAVSLCNHPSRFPSHREMTIGWSRGAGLEIRYTCRRDPPPCHTVCRRSPSQLAKVTNGNSRCSVCIGGVRSACQPNLETLPGLG